MERTLYQIMIRIKDSFVMILQDKLKVSSPTILEEQDVYFQSKGRDRTEKLTESQGRIFHEVITKEEHMFHIDQKDIPAAERDQLLADDAVSVRLNRHRELYLVNGVEVSIDRIDELGTFLEIEGADRSAVESVATSLGFRAAQFIEHPYDWLKR